MKSAERILLEDAMALLERMRRLGPANPTLPERAEEFDALKFDARALEARVWRLDLDRVTTDPISAGAQ